MPLTVVVRSTAGGEARLTFDGTQRIVLGRGAGCDVRLPDTTVSLRHASLRAQGADFVVVDEGSVNGTFVGGVRVAPHTSRIVRSGELVRLGRVWIELRVDRSLVTRDLAAATRDLALALVSEAMGAMGSDRATKLRVVEGRDQGATLVLAEEGRVYVVGRGAECELPLADADASREHARVVRRGTSVLVRDLDAKNGTWLGEMRVAQDRDVPWKPGNVLQIGHTAIALEEPVGDTLVEIENAPDQPMAPDEPVDPPAGAPSSPPRKSGVPEASPPSAAPLAELPELAAATARPRSGWTPTDLMVMAAAIGVLALSIAGLYWLLRG
jgi:pSer/pThr/pTyr-binding forkhead associated (FHA) protein